MKKYILIFLASLLLFSCYPARYVHAPLIVSGTEEKGEYTVSGAFSTTTDTKSFNVHGNYAISNHIILQSSFTYRDDYSQRTYNYKINGNALDFALGYTNNTKNKNSYFEGFLGYGSGKVYNTSVLELDSYANFKYNKIFSQVGFNLKFDSNSPKSNYFSMHFPIRIEYMHYNKIAFNNFNQGSEENFLEQFSENPNLWVFSIGKTLNYNLKNVTFSLFGSYHSPTNVISFVTLGNFHVGLGVTWRNFLTQKKSKSI